MHCGEQGGEIRACVGQLVNLFYERKGACAPSLKQEPHTWAHTRLTEACQKDKTSPIELTTPRVGEKIALSL